MFDSDNSKDIAIDLEPDIHIIEYHSVNLVRIVLVPGPRVLCQYLLQGGYIGLCPAWDVTSTGSVTSSANTTFNGLHSLSSTNPDTASGWLSA